MDWRVTTREHRGTPTTLAREERMIDRVDGLVLAMQTTDCQPVLDRACAETELAELGVGRNGVMIGGKRCDPMIDVVSPSHVKG
jgi:copper oxidase (laccase) domain-containing protein